MPEDIACFLYKIPFEQRKNGALEVIFQDIRSVPSIKEALQKGAQKARECGAYFEIKLKDYPLTGNPNIVCIDFAVYYD